METNLTEQAQLLTERRALKIRLQIWPCGNAFPIKPRHSIAFFIDLSLPDLDQLDVEYEDPKRRPLALIGEPLGNPEACFLSLDHQLQSFGPPRNNSVEWKGRRFTARNGAVEHLAVGCPARVIDRNLGKLLRMAGAGAHL